MLDKSDINRSEQKVIQAQLRLDLKYQQERRPKCKNRRHYGFEARINQYQLDYIRIVESIRKR